MPKTHLTSAKASNFSPPDAYYPTDTGQSLAMALYDFYNFVVATEFCNLRHVSSVTCRMMSHVQYVYQSIAKRRFKCSRSLKGKEVATRAHNVLKDTCRSVAMCRSVQRLHKRRVETMRREANREGDVTNDSDADPDWSTQETDTFEDGEVPQAELGQQEDGESEEEGETSQKGAEPEKEPKTLACKTARRKRPCLVPGCKGFSRVNLKRHLTKVHYSKGELSKDDVERLFALSCAGSKKSGPIRQYAKKKSVPQVKRRRWCPVEGCNFLGEYLPQHLTQVHKMEHKCQRYKNTLRMARHYQGSHEEIQSWRPPVSTPLPPKPTSPLTPTKRPLVEIYTDSSLDSPAI
ncbi:uncharacterized protein LOC111331049 [Stylophora pistillata]|uniref:uncharacterized protein LOC111331049 n=1 Tax=Stylophora pistillata TaxID=50429 RepID=UPI000C0498A3|nr:uncharacterized protein LOC111331049 [Stylophora pistillata]